MTSRSFKLSLAFVGTFIGAGFATGREICSFFANSSIFTTIIAGLLCGAFGYVFMEIGRKTRGEIFKIMPNSLSIALSAMTKLISLVVLTSMIASTTQIIEENFNVLGMGFLVGLIGLVISSTGTKWVAKINAIIVPFVTVFVIILFIMAQNFNLSGDFNLSYPFLYAGMNVLASGIISSKLSRDLAKKEVVCASIFSGIILAVLLTIVLLATRNVSSADMPIITLATVFKLRSLSTIIVFVAIFTTLTSTMNIVSDGKIVHGIVALLVATVFSFFGFSRIVSYAYPVVGLASIVVLLALVLALFINARIIKVNSRISS